jgi:hypothetical protein
MGLYDICDNPPMLNITDKLGAGAVGEPGAASRKISGSKKLCGSL